MKKTIIASAIAAVAAAPAAFADVSLKGNVMAEFVEDNMVTRNDFVISAKEDLGNGMTAAIKMHQVYDDTGTAGADRTVSISGDFGTLTAGHMEGFQEGIFDSFIEVDAAHDTTLESGGWDNGVEGFKRAARVMYVSPSMNGLSLGITSNGNGTDDKFTDNEVMVKYSNAGLTVMAGMGDVDGGNQFENLVATYKMGDLELRAGYRGVERAAVASATTTTYEVLSSVTGLTDTTVVANAAAVNAGETKVIAGGVDQTTGAALAGADTVAVGDVVTVVSKSSAVAKADLDSTFIGAKYTMGANVIGLGFVDSDTADESIVSLQHNFSKTTSAYITQHNVDGGANTTVIGLAKKF